MPCPIRRQYVVVLLKTTAVACALVSTVYFYYTVGSAGLTHDELKRVVTAATQQLNGADSNTVSITTEVYEDEEEEEEDDDADDVVDNRWDFDKDRVDGNEPDKQTDNDPKADVQTVWPNAKMDYDHGRHWADERTDDTRETTAPSENPTSASDVQRNPWSPEVIVPIVMTFNNAARNPSLLAKFRTCLESILVTAGPGTSLDLYLIGDDHSFKSASQIADLLSIQQNRSLHKLRHISDADVATAVQDLVSPTVMNYFRFKPEAYYGAALFFLSLALHAVPQFEHLSQVILLDADLKFRTDIRHLFGKFAEFRPQQIVGIGHELSPVYRHVFATYRRAQDSRGLADYVGGPRPKGHPGFNSGVVLMDLSKIRADAENFELLTAEESVSALARKYSFKGHLGDQDFHTIVSMERPELYFILGCGWNRQLCQWWRSHGNYANFFEQYHACNETVHVYHGNCNTPIPDD